MRRILWAVLCAFSMSSLPADDWPQWLGPKRDGVWREEGILQSFPPEGPKILWRTPLGGGYAGPAVTGARLFITDRIAGPALERKRGDQGPAALPGEERIACLNALDGKLIWEHRYPSAYRIDYPAGPRAIPIVVAGRVYTLGAMGDLKCLDAESGEVRWSRSFMRDFGLEEPPLWGWAAHPLVHEGKVISLVGGKGSAVAAFDAGSGKEIWRALTTKEIGYAPPIIAKFGGREQLIVWHSDAVSALNPKDGALIWTVPYPVEGKAQRPEVTIAMPRVSGNLLFLTSFYHGSQMLEIDNAKPAATVLWDRHSSSRSRFNAGLHTTMSTPVFKDGYIYGICGGGELRCLDARTGERIWESTAVTGGKAGPFGSAFLIEQADRCFIWSDQGDLIIAKLTPGKYEEISRAHLLDPVENARGRDVVWCSPAFANRSLYVRNSQELICISLAAEEG